jgi:AcrR family transcriptional regulator
MKVLNDEIRKQILSTAGKEFHDKGFQNASMRTIAQKTGISVSNIYNYYGSKQDIFYALTEKVFHVLKNMAKELSEFQKKNCITKKDFFRSFNKFVPDLVIDLIKSNRNGLLLILEYGKGTKYADVKDRLVDTLTENFNLNSGTNDSESSRAESRQPFLLRIIVMNLVQGLIEIMDNYRDDAWADETIKALLNYHISGLTKIIV